MSPRPELFPLNLLKVLTHFKYLAAILFLPNVLNYSNSLGQTTQAAEPLDHQKLTHLGASCRGQLPKQTLIEMEEKGASVESDKNKPW